MDAVSVTAQWMAAARARESARADRLFEDPLSEILSGPEGFELLDAMEAQATVGSTSLLMVVRTRFFDDAIERHVDGRQISQVVVLAAGMDARAFRLSWPPEVRLFELDRPDVLAVKESRLQTAGARAGCDRVTVDADLVDEWTSPLLAAGFDVERPSPWLVEGLLFFLDRDGVQRLLGQLGALADTGSVLLTDLVGTTFLSHPWTQARLEAMADRGMPFRFGTDDPENLLREHGWEDGANFGRWPHAVASPHPRPHPRPRSASGPRCRVPARTTTTKGPRRMYTCSASRRGAGCVPGCARRFAGVAGPGPVLELGPGSGLGTEVILAAVLHRPVLAAEPSPALRAVLLARLSSMPGGDRVTVEPQGAEDVPLPARLSAVVGMHMIGALPPERRRRLFATLAERLAPDGPVVVNVQPPAQPIAVPPFPWVGVRQGDLTYRGTGRAEPVGDGSVVWTMTYQTLRGEQVLDASTATYRWCLCRRRRWPRSSPRSGSSRGSTTTS